MRKIFKFISIFALFVLFAGCATTPLRDSVGRGDIYAVKNLLDKGGDVNEIWYGQPLLFATVVDPVWGLNTIGCRPEMAKLLLERGANIDEAMSHLELWMFGDKNESKSGIKLLERMKQEIASQPAMPVTKLSQEIFPVVKSDIDELPAIKAKPNKNHYAIVIGIENYRQKLPKADFATSDAKTMTEYLTKAMGYPDENVVTLLNDRALKSDMEKYFEKWLSNNVEKDGTVFVYYSGHGAPNPKTGDAYLVPYDGDPAFIDQTGYSLKKLYENFGKLQAKEIIVALDSCFSGAGGRSVIAKGARLLVMQMEALQIPSKISVLSAASGDQISSTYEEKGHGLFTYFMLKGIKGEGDANGDGNIEIGELFEYIKPQVERTASKKDV